MKKIFLLFLIIFIAKAAFTLSLPSPWVFGDEYIYTAKTRAILNEGNFNFDKYHYGGPSVPPLYSIVLLPMYFFNDTDFTYHAVLVWNAFLSTMIIIPIFLLCRRFIKEWQALFLAAAIGFLPAGFGYSFIIMSENIFFPLFAWSVFFLYKMITDEKNIKWCAAMGIVLGALFLAKAIALAPIIAYAVFVLTQFLISKKKSKFLEGQIVVFSLMIITVFWWFLVKEGNGSGYETSSYLEVLRQVLNDKTVFLEFLKLISHEFAYLGLATWFVGLPLTLAYLWVPKKETHLRSLWQVAGYTIMTTLFLIGISALHMMQYIDINPERYAVFGRYVEVVVPVLIMLAGILIFQKKEILPNKWRAKTLGLFLLMTALTIIVLPRIPYDLVANIPIWSLQFLSVNIFYAVLIVAGLIGFFAISMPKRGVPVLLGFIIIGSITLMPLPYKDGLRQSKEIEDQISPIRDWVTKNVAQDEIIGFDETHLWDRNYIRQFWALKFWLKNPVEKGSIKDNKYNYLISSEVLNKTEVAKGWELMLYENK